MPLPRNLVIQCCHQDPNVVTHAEQEYFWKKRFFNPDCKQDFKSQLSYPLCYPKCLDLLRSFHTRAKEKNEKTEREKMKTVNSNLDHKKILLIFITVAPWARTNSRLPRTTNHCQCCFSTL